MCVLYSLCLKKKEKNMQVQIACCIFGYILFSCFFHSFQSRSHTHRHELVFFAVIVLRAEVYRIVLFLLLNDLAHVSNGFPFWLFRNDMSAQQKRQTRGEHPQTDMEIQMNIMDVYRIFVHMPVLQHMHIPYCMPKLKTNLKHLTSNVEHVLAHTTLDMFGNTRFCFCIRLRGPK